jgi:hypothetical protein
MNDSKEIEWEIKRMNFGKPMMGKVAEGKRDFGKSLTGFCGD